MLDLRRGKSEFMKGKMTRNIDHLSGCLGPASDEGGRNCKENDSEKKAYFHFDDGNFNAMPNAASIPVYFPLDVDGGAAGLLRSQRPSPRRSLLRLFGLSVDRPTRAAAAAAAAAERAEEGARPSSFLKSTSPPTRRRQRGRAAPGLLCFTSLLFSLSPGSNASVAVEEGGIRWR